MERRSCGVSGLELSVLGLGCWQFGGGDYWGQSDQVNVDDVVRVALDGGINYFDTAELYNDGRSEVFLGKALEGIARDRIVVGSKVWPTHLHPDTLRKHCEASLQRLAMEYVDIYMIHWPLYERSYPLFSPAGEDTVTPSVPLLEDVVDMQLQLQSEGKIKHLGLSNYGVERCEELRHIADRFAVNQLVYNLVTRAAEYAVLPYCEQARMGVITYMTLMQGLLTDLYQTLDDIPDWYTRTRHFNSERNPKTRHGEAGVESILVPALQAIRTIAYECHLTTAELALRWTIANQQVTCALVGTQNPKRLKANIEAANEPLPAEVVHRLNTVTEALKGSLGPGLDIFENVQRDRTC